MENVASDFTRLCRTCKISSEDMKSIFDYCEVFNEGPRIDEMLMACTSIQVKAEDGLPDSICVKCVVQLKNAYDFLQQCRETDASFRENTKIIKHDDIKPDMQNVDTFCNDSNTDSISEVDDKVEPPTAQSDYIELMDNNQMILTCRECGKAFTTLEGLRSHKRIHLGTLFKCQYCDKAYTRQNHVYRHELCHGKHKMHVCKICGKTMHGLEPLKRHLTTHLKDKPFTCKSCNRGFNRSDHLDVHALRCKGDRVHICDICNRGFSRADSLEVHKRLHENQAPVLPTIENINNIEEHYYEIDYDPNLDYSPTSDVDDYLEPHVEVNESVNAEESQEGISRTGDEFNMKSDENMELMDIKNILQIDEANVCLPENEQKTNIDLDYMETESNFNDDGNDMDSSDEDYVARKRPTKIKRGRGRPRKPLDSKQEKPRKRPRTIKKEADLNGDFPCPSCDERFDKLSLLEKHSKTHSNVKVNICKICNKHFSRYNHLKRHMQSHNKVKPFPCDICGKRFSRREHLQKHIVLHDKKQEFGCDICPRICSRADLLAKHKISRHNVGDKNITVKKFECSICLKSFTTEKYRDVHVRAHLGEKRFQCKTCDKCFLSKSHLTEHMKFHNEHSKKFLCSECGQRFIRNDYLVIHMRRHRGEKPFKCKFCGKGFPRTTDLTVHERYHTGEKTHLCTICGRGFGRAYNLTVHMRTHTGEKPYQCSYCEAAFAQGNDLKAHIRRHTGERFQCELCSESFLMGYLLTQHKRTVHGLNVVSNIRRLQPLNKIKQDSDEPPPITITLPKPVVPDNILNNIQSQMVVQMQQQMKTE